MRNLRSERKVHIVVPIIGLMVLIGLISAAIAPLITEYQIQTLLSGRIVRSSSTGAIKTAHEPYKVSPFGVDYVIEGSDVVTHEFYATGIAPIERAPGDAAETMIVFLSRPTTVEITFTIENMATARRPRVHVYNDVSRLIDTANMADDTRAFAPFTNPYTVKLALPAGLFRVKQMFMRDDVGSIRATFVPDATTADTLDFDAYVIANTKTLEFDIMPGQMARLTELRRAQEINWARLPSGDWSKRFLPSPKESVQVQVRSEHGNWAFAELKLSGRNAAHKSVGGLPSSDISVKAGELPYGLKRFKLYVVQSKTSGIDMFMERLINDFGQPVNREDLVKIIVNGELFGYMQIYEDFDTSLFESGQFVEGPVIGYDTDPLIATAGHSWYVPKSYYSNSIFAVDQEIDIGTRELTARFCPFAMGNTLAMGIFYNGMHGLGADTRFLFDFRRHCVNPIYKDLNRGVYAVSPQAYERRKNFLYHPALLALRQFSVLSPEWRPFTPTYASYFVARRENKPDKQGFYFYWTVQPPVLNYSNAPERDAEFLMAMERLYNTEHSNRYEHRMKNYERAIALLNAQPLQSMPLRSMRALQQLSTEMPYSRFQDMMNVPAQCDDSYLRTVISTASAGVVTPDCRTLHRLEWRNSVVQDFLKTPVTDTLGLKVTQIPLTTGHMTFLYQTDRGPFTEMFFAERSCALRCDGNLTLRDDETGEIITPIRTIELGAETPSLTQWDLLLQNVAPNEKLRVVYFSIPKKDRYQHLIPQYRGSSQYYGSHGVAIMPLSTRPENEKSITNVASTVPYAPVEEFFDVNGSVLTWKKNLPVPDKLVYVPAGYTWKVDEPLSIALAKHGCFEIWGNLEIADDATLDLTDSGNGWSGIHFYHNRDLQIQNLTVRNGGYNEEFVYCGSRRFTTVVGFYETTVHLKNLQIRQNMSEDALHLVHTDMILEDSSIVGSISDGVDSDFSSVVFRNFTIEGAGTLGENGGDALDFSGSLAQLHEVHLHQSSDKNLSVGENSVVNIYDSDLVGGNFGIAIKDASVLTVQRTTIEGAKTGIGIYSKKPYYTRPVFDLAQHDVTFKDVGVAFNPEASAE
jgi:hypothetical protein